MVGEIADMLNLKHPEKKLLVDVSSDLPGHEIETVKKYPTRTTLTFIDDEMIEHVLSKASVGDVVKAKGTFTQTNYIPYRTTSIDTTFLVEKFTILEKTTKPKQRFNQVYSDALLRSVH